MTKSHISPDELRAWRKGLGATQATAARALGVSLRSIARWEAGDQPMPLVAVKAMTEAARRIRRGRTEKASRERRARREAYQERQEAKREERRRLRGERNPAAWW